MAYDALKASHPRRAEKQYLQILHLAARETETGVDDALRVLLGRDGPLTAQLESCLKELCLPTARACYAELVQKATQESLSYEQFLLELMERERDGRWHRRIQRLLRESRLPLDKSFHSFEMKRLPPKLRQQVASLREGCFLDRRENILAFGKPGSGKTHLLCALCQELVRQGRRLRYTTCSLLVQELLVGQARSGAAPGHQALGPLRSSAHR
jgi:DNA replication protein DnaC